MMRRILTATAMVVALLVVFAAAPAGAQSCPGRPTVSPPCGPPDVGGEGETPPPETPPENPPEQPPTVEPDVVTPPVIGGNPATPTPVAAPTPRNPTVLESVVRLPLTGTEIGPVGVLGLALTAAGLIFAVAGRRRRTSLDAAV